MKGKKRKKKSLSSLFGNKKVVKGRSYDLEPDPCAQKRRADLGAQRSCSFNPNFPLHACAFGCYKIISSNLSAMALTLVANAFKLSPPVLAIALSTSKAITLEVPSQIGSTWKNKQWYHCRGWQMKGYLGINICCGTGISLRVRGFARIKLHPEYQSFTKKSL